MAQLSDQALPQGFSYAWSGLSLEEIKAGKLEYRVDRQGNVREYRTAGVTDDQLAKGERRRMDCVDCHNRPTHIYVPPDRSVDRALLAGRIDHSAPGVYEGFVIRVTAAGELGLDIYGMREKLKAKGLKYV